MNLFDNAQLPSHYFILISFNQMFLIQFDTLCISLFMHILANSSYLKYYSCVTDAGTALGLEEAQEGENEAQEVPPGLKEWAGNRPM